MKLIEKSVSLFNGQFMTYKEALLKRKIETTLASPFVLAGKLLSRFFRPGGKHQLFLFAPSADIGGANLNNADLAKIFLEYKPIVIFSKRPHNNQFLSLYQHPGIALWDLHSKIDNKVYHFVNLFYRGVISGWINSSPHAIVIGGESLYFHKVFPWLKKEVKTIELTHVDKWFNYTQQFVKDMGTRVFSTRNLMKDAQDFYQKQKIDTSLFSRMTCIDNMVPVPEKIEFPQNQRLKVIFIGRGSAQKRVHIIVEIAQRAHEKKLPIDFSFVGDVSSIADENTLPFCTFYGNIKDREQLTKIQQQSDVLLLTSAFEGLPMVVMEMMALGKTIVSTAVNAIPDYIRDGKNGFLIPNDQIEDKIADDSLLALSILASDRRLLQSMGELNRKEAQEKFSRKTFEQKWKALLESKQAYK